MHSGSSTGHALPIATKTLRKDLKEPKIQITIIGRGQNVQQLTCNIDLSNYFYYLFFSFVLLEPKPFVFKWKVPGAKNSEKSAKKCEKV